jgi:hypothetical protein
VGYYVVDISTHIRKNRKREAMMNPKKQIQDSGMVQFLKPEERELHKKLEELDALEAELVERELELASLSVDIRVFEVHYLHAIGNRYAKLDEIIAKIAEIQARVNPGDFEALKIAAEARKKASQSEHDVNSTIDIPQNTKEQSDGLKKLYRAIAHKIHPDLCTDEKERLRREKLMVEANRAFEKGDEESLHRILNDWDNSPESIKGEDIAAQLVRVLRKIAQVEERIQRLMSEISLLRKSDLFELMMKVEKAKTDGYDLLAEMASRLDKEISEAENRLKNIANK